jgi:hypothetical protein
MKHNPLMQGNPCGTCSEYGEFFFENGLEYERCPVCGEVGRVVTLGPASFMTASQIADEFIKLLKKNLGFLQEEFREVTTA